MGAGCSPRIVRAAALAPGFVFVALLKCSIRVKKYIFVSEKCSEEAVPPPGAVIQHHSVQEKSAGGQVGPSGVGMGKPLWWRGTWSGIAWEFFYVNLIDVPYVKSVRSCDSRKPPSPPDGSLWSSWDGNSFIRTLREMLWTVPKIPVPHSRHKDGFLCVESTTTKSVSAGAPAH